jgi:ubiquinone/menaquinone biosynthesis C-methylase UbiE
MNVQEAYTHWSEQYDTNINRTRDLEGVALRATLDNITFDNCLEIGCGTGKNTAWFVTKARHITAVDLTESMLAVARAKVTSNKVQFIQADITHTWDFAIKSYDLVGFSLILEHIENLEPIFEKTAQVLKSGGYVYVGELHPFKQYTGTKARFETSEGVQIVPCFNHNISDFIHAAQKFDLDIVAVNEYFDDGDRTTIPRILTLLFRKK